MGMYTKMHVNLELKEDTPREVIDVLRHMTDPGQWPEMWVPDHPLFQTSRGPYVLRMSNVGPAFAQFHYDHIFNVYTLQTMSELKNYDSDIEAFFDWITPYVETRGKTFVGYSLYEEASEPTLFFVGTDE